jgi:23S rRNA-/tRNA-specific pseudouridylate synthase
VSLLRRAEPGILAFSKPAGVLSHPNEPDGEQRALLTCAYSMEEECFTWEGGRLWLLNRLDSATSGVILCAESQPLAQAVRQHFKSRQVSKTYNALVFGVPSVPTQLWRDRVAVSKVGGQIRTSGGEGNIPCESGMQLLAKRGGSQPVSLLRLDPHTGRSHQLRVQCAQRKLPIVGDATYGNFPANRIFAQAQGTKRLFLHSLETRFQLEYQGRKYAFSASAPLPEEFARALA